MAHSTTAVVSAEPLHVEGGESLATLTISSKNYSSWSLRAWLMAKLSGVPFIEEQVEFESDNARAELLLLAPSILVPCLTHNGIRIWDTLSIGEYLNEIAPNSGLHPTDLVRRAHCRSISGEMHFGFAAMRASLPMNLRAQFSSFTVWSKAQADINRILEIWSQCLDKYGGPFLFGERPNFADAMFAPVATRFVTYAVSLPHDCQLYRDAIISLPEMQEWRAAALQEPEELEELDMDF